MNKLSILAIAGTALFSLGASAKAQISYNYFEVGYSFQSFDRDILGDEDSSNGVSVGLSMSPANYLFGFVNGSWGSLDIGDNFDLQAGIGVYYPISNNLDIVGRAAWAFNSLSIDDLVDREDLADAEDENGVVFDVGVRGMITPNIELGAFVGYENLGDVASGAAVDVYGIYHTGNGLGIGLAGQLGDGDGGFRAFLRWAY